MGKVQFIVDEAASVGQMDALGDAIDKLRGYGVRLLLLYQSLGQLKKCWPEGQDQTLLSNVTQVFFGVSDLQTAQYVSDRLGEQTIAVSSGGTSSGESSQRSGGDPNESHSVSWNSNDNWNQVGRKLLKPEEVLALDPRIAITFAPGLRPVATTLLRYFEERLGTPPSRWAAFWPWAKVVVSSTLCFFAASLLALMVTAGAVSKQTQKAAEWPPTSANWSQP